MPENLVSPGFKMQIRGNYEGNVVNARIVNDEQTDGFPVSSFNMAIAQAHPELYKEWQKLMEKVISVVCEEITGHKPITVSRVVPQPA